MAPRRVIVEVEGLDLNGDYACFSRVNGYLYHALSGSGGFSQRVDEEFEAAVLFAEMHGGILTTVNVYTTTPNTVSNDDLARVISLLRSHYPKSLPITLKGQVNKRHMSQPSEVVDSFSVDMF